MPSEVRHQVDGGQAYPVFRLTGVLDAATAPSVRTGLLDLLAGQPEAVVVDVRQLTVGDPAAVGVLREVARDAAAWPDCHLVLTAGPETAAWNDAGLPVWPVPEEAFAALGTPEPRHFLRTALEPVVGAARRSRELVTEACGRWELPELAGPACIVVTEMVNNVVAHARTPMTVLLALRGEGVAVAVRDRSTYVPRFTGSPVPVTSYGGRGLLLIDSVARRWGSLVLGDGKVVWAALDPPSNHPATTRDRTEDLSDEPVRQVSGTGMAGRARG
jgi:anti-anti-sigma regulatory factor